MTSMDKKAKPRSPARVTKKACKKVTDQFKSEVINDESPTGDNKGALQPKVCARVDHKDASCSEQIVAVDVGTFNEEELKSFGYQPIKTIGLKNKDDHVVYIKSINKLGQTVYIMMDVMNNINCDMTLVETQDTFAASGIKTHMMNLTGFDVHGVAIECDQHGVCVLNNVMTNDETTRLVETNYATSSVTNVTDGCHLSFPIVTLSEIKHNPDLVLEGSNIVTRKIRNSFYQTYVKDMIHVRESIDQLNNAYQRLVTLFEQDALKLNETLSTLENYNNHYINHPPTDDNAIKKSNLILYNMKVRHDYVSQLLCGMQRATNYKAQIDHLVDEVDEFLEFFESQYDVLDTLNHL